MGSVLPPAKSLDGLGRATYRVTCELSPRTCQLREARQALGRKE